MGRPVLVMGISARATSFAISIRKPKASCFKLRRRVDFGTASTLLLFLGRKLYNLRGEKSNSSRGERELSLVSGI